MLKYLAAYAMVALQKEPTKDDVRNVMKAGGVSVDNADLDLVFTQIGKRSMSELLADGNKKMAAAPAAAGAPAAAAAAGGAAPAAGKAKKEEPEEEEDDDFGMGGLF